MDDIAAINEGFYRAEPVDYFLTRIALTLRFADDPDALGDALRQGLRAHGLSLQFPELSFESADVQRYVSVEATIIAHHAIETFLRLFLGHASGNPCPALAIASERSPGAFKKRVETMIVSDDHLADLRTELGQVVLGVPSSADAAELDARDRCVPLVRDLAHLWLNDAELYNSLKHGLTGVPGDAMLLFGPIRSEGPSFEYLTKASSSDKEPEWSTRLQWVDIQQTLGAALAAVFMIENVWLIARWRYVGAELPEKVYRFVDMRLRDLAGSPSSLHRFDRKLNVLRRR